MKLVVLGGSPKGEVSVTLQYVKYIQQEFPQHEYREFLVSQNIRQFEKNEAAFNEVIEGIRGADAVLWAVPVYVCLVPAQYKRFIELVWERGVQDAFRGKYAASLTTSIHFFDDTAHAYLRGISEDLGMNYVGKYSPEMKDLTRQEGRRQTRLFAEQLFTAVAEQWKTPRRFFPANESSLRYEAGKAVEPVDTRGKKILLLHDARDPESNLAHMVNRLQRAFGGVAEAVNLYDIDLKGGCLGCLQCGWENRCVYQDKDGNKEFHEKKIASADIIVFGGSIVDRYVSARWKMFYDRAFFKNHVPWWEGKHMAWLIAGPLAQNANIRHILEQITDMQGADLVDIVTDEAADSPELDRQLDRLAARLVAHSEEKWTPVLMGPAVGGHKIFRDAIYDGMRFVFHADHLYYKTHNRYDFPRKTVLKHLGLLAAEQLFRIPSLRERFYKKELKAGMIRPLQKVLSARR